MNYVILQKARPYTRTRRGRFEHVKGYTGKPKKWSKTPSGSTLEKIESELEEYGKGSPRWKELYFKWKEDKKLWQEGKIRIHKIDEKQAKEDRKQLNLIFKDIQNNLKKRLKKIAPNLKVKFKINEGTLADWEEVPSEFTKGQWIPRDSRDNPWISWEIANPGKWGSKEWEKYMGSGGLTFYPLSLHPNEGHEKMEFKIDDSEWGDKLKNKGLYSAIFSALAEARDKGWLGNQMHVHMGLGTKAWGKLAKKFKFDWEGLEYQSGKKKL